MSQCYVVFTEEFYGGGSAVIKAFRTPRGAQQYASSLQLDTFQEQFTSTGDTVFVVVNENWYGGGDLIRAFSTAGEADRHRDAVTRPNPIASTDAIVVECSIQP